MYSMYVEHIRMWAHIFCPLVFSPSHDVAVVGRRIRYSDAVAAAAVATSSAPAATHPAKALPRVHHVTLLHLDLRRHVHDDGADADADAGVHGEGDTHRRAEKGLSDK